MKMFNLFEKYFNIFWKNFNISSSSPPPLAASSGSVGKLASHAGATAPTSLRRARETVVG
jgi:hypothetical protein